MGEASLHTENFKLVFFFSPRVNIEYEMEEEISTPSDLCNISIISIIHLKLGLALEYTVFNNE